MHLSSSDSHHHRGSVIIPADHSSKFLAAAIEDRASRRIDRLFEAQVERTPDRIAIVFEDQKLTYRELNNRANQLAYHLQNLGLEVEELVGICVERSIEMIVGILGILKAGGVYVPLDPSNPQDRLAYMIRDAQIKILVTESILLTNLPDSDRVICLDLTTITDYPTTNLPDSEQSVSEHRLAQIIYTSGSTGQPKGVLVNHANVVRLFTATAHWYRFGENDVWTLFHSFAFDFSVWEIWGALLYGGRLVVVPYLISRDATAFYRLLVTEQVTVLNQTPSAFYQLNKVDERLHLSEKLSLRLIIFGGEVLNLPSLASWFDRHGDAIPQLVNMYGITEATVHVTYHPLTDADVKMTRSLIGRPIPDLQVYLLDEYLQPVEIGVSGEMYVGGAGVTQGYWQRAELTRTRFIKHPFSPDPTARLYQTGDLARYLPDGNLEYLRRIDNQVKIRGFRIELGEIEAALSQHPAIESSIVIAAADLHGTQQLVAYLVTPTDLLTPTQLSEFLAGKLPIYMIPTVFAIISTIPLTVNGKVDRQALSEHKIAAQIIKNSPILGSNDQLKPRPNSMITSTQKDRTEEILIAIWSQILGQSPIGINESFFELGGNSISIIQVAVEIKQHLNGIEIPIVKLFQYPTIARLAAYLNSVDSKTQPDQQLKNRAQQQKAALDARRRSQRLN
jgi:amino acid adenylation domain-containing protein